MSIVVLFHFNSYTYNKETRNRKLICGVLDEKGIWRHNRPRGPIWMKFGTKTQNDYDDVQMIEI